MKKLSELPVGAKVKDVETKYNGVPIVWQIGGHNHYATGQTVLVSEKFITLKPFDAKEASNTNSERKTAGNNRYSQSNIRQWLNSAEESWYAAQHSADAPPNNANVWNSYNDYDQERGFLANFGANLRNALIATSLTTAKNTVTDGGGSEVVSDKVFLLSKKEVGLANENSIAEGKLLAMFSDDASRVAYPTAEAVTNSEYKETNLVASKAYPYWLRSPSASYSYSVRIVSYNGTLANNGAFYGYNGVRPALNLSSDILASDSVDSDGVYILFSEPLEPRYLFSKTNTAYTIENNTFKPLGTITTANASTLFASGVEAITKEHCVLVGQQLGKAKIMRMLV